jgi:integrase
MKRHESKNRKPVVVKIGSTAVKIYSGKSGGYDLFTLVYHAGGRRRRETFAHLGRAKVRAAEVARDIQNGRIAVLELSNTDRESYVHALELLKPLGIPLHNAVEEYVAARSHLHGDESLLAVVKSRAAGHRHVVERPVGEIVDELLAAKQRDGLSLRYIQTLRSRLSRFAQAFQTGIGSITGALISDFVTSLKSGPVTRNNMLRSVLTLFLFARQRGYLPKGVPTEAEDIPKVKERGGAVGILTPKEASKLLRAANDEARLYLALGAFTGLRTAELIRLDWKDVNVARDHIVVGAHKAKTATRRLVPILPNLSKWLTQYLGRTGRVFASEHATDRTIAFAKSCGVDWPPNCLRHSFATYRLAQTHDAARVALELGNSPAILFRNYRELVDEETAKDWFAIEPSERVIVPMSKAKVA